MLDLDQKKLKCASILGILFFVLSHPYLYKLFHRSLSHIVSFLDVDGCPTELGVLIMAIIFVAVVYFGHDQLENSKKGKNNNKNNNIVLNKCRTYCEQVTNELSHENALVNNNGQINNNAMNNNLVMKNKMNNVAMNNQAMNNVAMNNQAMNNQAMNNQAMNNQAMNNQAMNNQAMNNQAMNNQAMNNQAMNNNVVVANNNQINQNRMNNQAMNNQLQNNIAQAPIPSVNLNNSNTGSTDMGLLNSQSCSDNPQCSGNNLVGGQAYDSNSLSNYGNGSMFTENTTYHDDMYASLF